MENRDLRGWRGSGTLRGKPVICEYIDDASLSDRWSARGIWSWWLLWYLEVSGEYGRLYDAISFTRSAPPPSSPLAAKNAGRLASSAILNWVNLKSSRSCRDGPGWTMGTRGLRARPNSFSPNRMSFHRHPVLRFLAESIANCAVRLARCLRWRLLNSQMMTTKMKAQPRAIKRICHQASLWDDVVTTVGLFKPEMLGRGALAVPDGWETTRLDRQTPSPATTLEVDEQLAATHDPATRTCVELEHARQLLGPRPKQLEQLESQDWQVDDVESKNCDLLQVGKHRPFVSTGLLGGQLVHWLKLPPEQLAQSGWHVRQDPEEENVLEGQLETHFPPEASWLLTHVRQNVGDPAHVPQDGSQAR